MSRPKKALSPEQVKQRLRMQGVTATQWAAAHGYTRNEVYRVLNGQSKAHYGKAHDIAVALGMKLADEQPITPAQHCNPQAAAVA
ncbi:DNA-binding protein [Xanthomonadaceae bacterium XH05]|nr:DNA-binding protein [Xanthomonadaceae bacterium XH05]